MLEYNLTPVAGEGRTRPFRKQAADIQRKRARCLGSQHANNGELLPQHRSSRSSRGPSLRDSP